eukprot:9199420-Prorocentrum_lima.AAC.1
MSASGPHPGAKPTTKWSGYPGRPSKGPGPGSKPGPWRSWPLLSRGFTTGPRTSRTWRYAG